MSINNIVFNNLQVADLYNNQLVNTATKAAVVSQPDIVAGISFKGKNKKRIVWLIDETEQLFLNDEDFQFATKVLEACHLSLEDIALVNMNQEDNLLQTIITELEPQLLIASGVQTEKIAFNAMPYTIHQDTSYKLFITDSLSEMRNDALKKSKLWVGLKELLSIK